MKNKAPLSLMEQLVMLLVFALAAGLCLQVFVLSDRMSRGFEARDHAVLAVQNTAEVLKVCEGDLDACAALYGGTVSDAQWQLTYDAQWNCVSGEYADYCVVADVKQEQPLLGTALVSAKTSDGETLFEVTVSWQEAAHE